MVNQAGARMGKVLADLSARARVQAHGVTLPGELAMKAKDREAFLELLERELSPALRPLLASIAEHDDTPDELRPLLRMATGPTKQVESIAVISALVFAIQPLAQAVTLPLVTQVGQVAWGAHPSKVLGAEQAAELVVRGVWDRGRAINEAHGSGIETDRFDALVEGTGNPPAPEQLGEMLRRGIIDAGEFAKGIRQGRTKVEWTNELAALRFQVLPAAQAVEAAVQGALPHDVAARKAELSGIHADDFETLFEVAGNPPGFVESLEMLRRGIIDEATLRRIVAESRTKTKYTDALLRLRNDVPSKEQAIAGEVQGQLDHARAVAAFEKAGGDPADYEWLFGVAGDPIAVGQALDLWKRELIDEATVDQVIRESRVKPKYLDVVKLLATRIVPLEQTGRLMHHGIWTEAEGAHNLRKLGFEPAMADALAAMYAADNVEGDNEFAKGEVRALYRAELIDHQRAHDLLVALGKSDDYADYMLSLDDAVKARARLDRNVNVVRTKYLAFRIDSLEASDTLDRVGVTPAARDAYLDEWDALREATTRDLTEAQLATALRRQLIDAAEYVRRAQTMGYTEADANLLLAIHTAAAQGG